MVISSVYWLICLHSSEQRTLIINDYYAYLRSSPCNKIPTAIVINNKVAFRNCNLQTYLLYCSISCNILMKLCFVKTATKALTSYSLS